ncbi:MAG: TraX family protein [Lachnospiraceae bacterium]
MTNFVLKIIVLVAYTISNVALVLVDGASHYLLYNIMRSIGQIALPIVCFLLVEGFHKTSNRKMYFLRLLTFGALAELPFIYMSMEGLKIVEAAIHTYIGPEAAFTGENVKALQALVSENAYAYYYDIFLYTSTSAVDGMLTIAMNLLMLCLLDKIKKKYFGVKVFPYIALTTLTMLGTIVVCAIILPFEEPILITLLVAMFYFLRGNKPAISVMMLLAIMSFYIDISLTYAMGAIVSVLLIYTYTGKEGPKKFKYLFYLYYPAHMGIIYLLTKLI